MEEKMIKELQSEFDDQKREPENIRKNWRQRMWLKILCVVLSFVCFAGFLVSTAAAVLTKFEGVDNEEYCRTQIENITDFYELEMLQKYNSLKNGAMTNISDEDVFNYENYHFMVADGKTADEVEAALKKGNIKFDKQNTTRIPDDIVPRIKEYRLGQNSGFNMGYVEFGPFDSYLNVTGSFIEADYDKDYKIIDGYGINEQTGLVYVKSGKDWYELDSSAYSYNYSVSSKEDDYDSAFYSEYYIAEKDYRISNELSEDDVVEISVVLFPDSGNEHWITFDELDKLTLDDKSIANEKAYMDSPDDEGAVAGMFYTTSEDASSRPVTVVSYVGYGKEDQKAEAVFDYSTEGYVGSIAEGDYYSRYLGMLQMYEGISNTVIPLMIVLLIASFVFFVLSAVMSGHVNKVHPRAKVKNYMKCEKTGGFIEISGLGLIPMDLFAVITFIVDMVFVMSISSAMLDVFGFAILGFVVGMCCFAMTYAFLIALITNIKIRRAGENTLCYMIGSAIGRGLKLLADGSRVNNLAKRVWLTFAVETAIESFVLIVFCFTVLSYIPNVAFLRYIPVVAFLSIIAFVVLKVIIAHLTKGHLAKMEVFAIEKMKSDRMQTELITNVSHDIKTPLTSIINYVDLLSKEDLPQGKVQEYIEVLKRQSARLKKLITDLIEASKASTGSIKLDMETIDAGVIISQASGEYKERLVEKNIDLVISVPDGKFKVNADSRRLWRVFDNLLRNIEKYALDGTRAYVDVTTARVLNGDNIYEDVVIEFKNISAKPLNISADELMERFVRGDEARSSEGSGLGLSIARSLVQLMGGQFELVIDGDLFKAVVRLPKC